MFFVSIRTTPVMEVEEHYCIHRISPSSPRRKKLTILLYNKPSRGGRNSERILPLDTFGAASFSSAHTPNFYFDLLNSDECGYSGYFFFGASMEIYMLGPTTHL